MSLTEYHHKRNFKKTPEPKGKVHHKSKQLKYLIQKHEASHLHYDFRLELEGVLKSWAIPKGPSIDPQAKRLAVQVEDHPIEYGNFEGVIPEGEYGGGTVMLWDKGYWEPLEDALKSYKAGKLSFKLHGKRLQGTWTLLQMRGKTTENNKNWLLIKNNDEYADAKIEMTQKYSTSVVSKRSMNEIAEQAENVWKGKAS